MTFPLSVEDAREHVETALGDDALQRLLDDAEQAITDQVGALGSVTAYVEGGGTYLFLPRRAASITGITEAYDSSTPLALAADDYRLGLDGVTVRRIDTGTNPRLSWYGGPVRVVLVAADDEAVRERVQIDLVRLALNYSPLRTGETIGDYSYQNASNSAWNYQTEREAILATLLPGVPGFA